MLLSLSHWYPGSGAVLDCIDSLSLHSFLLLLALLYVKSGIFYKRRCDLKFNGIEDIWIEVVINKKSVLFGLFYTPPPNFSAGVYSNIEESISLAVDTGNSDIIITGDFSSYVSKSPTKKKGSIPFVASSLCVNLLLILLTLQSILPLCLISFLLVTRCWRSFPGPAAAILLSHLCFCKFFCSKPKPKAFTRHIWVYNNVNFGLLRDKASSIFVML